MLINDQVIHSPMKAPWRACCTDIRASQEVETATLDLWQHREGDCTTLE